MNPADLLRQRVEESGLSVAQFARRVVLRTDRTVRRWLTGESPIPKNVRTWLEKPEKHPWP